MIPDISATRCPTCGWTMMQLRDTGRMGCADCYQAFDPMVAQAVSHLHAGGGADLPPAPTPPAPPPSSHDALPWPTRRAQRKR